MAISGRQGMGLEKTNLIPLRSSSDRSGERGERREGRMREEMREGRQRRGGEQGSRHGGGAALYGQDSARKAGGESRDVIPQLYPAVTVGQEGGGGEKRRGRNRKEKEEAV